MLSAGKRDRRVTLLRRVDARDSTGAAATSWQPVAQLWAAVHDRTGRETLAAGQGEAAAWDVRFTVLYREDLRRTDRIEYRGDTYRVVHIDELGRKAGLVLLCALELPR